MKTSVRDYSESIDFGTIHIDDIHCLAYVRFYNALKDFKVRVEADTPYNMLHVLTDVDLDIPDYATTSDVELPKSLKMGNLTDQMAKRLLMHTVRQSYDGNDAHLRDDSSRFQYRQEHYCGKKTNVGMAFNEGFAEYWAGECNGECFSLDLGDEKLRFLLWNFSQSFKWNPTTRFFPQIQLENHDILKRWIPVARQLEYKLI